MATITFNQYYAGGIFKQVSDADATGPSTTYNQYAPGGAMEQLRVVVGSPVLDQRAPGGIWPALAAGAA